MKAFLRTWLLSFFFCLNQFSASAAPRPPLPPLPELVPVLHRETFNAVYQAGVSNAEVVLPNYGTLRESWSGYALERVGVVVPFVIPGVDEQGHTNVAGANGAVRLWFSPYWSSTRTGEGKGPGVAATLLELVAADKNQAVTLWRLQVSEDGSVVALLGAGGTEPLLTAEIAWRAGTWHQIILNYDAGKGATELVLDGEKVAEGASVLAVPSRVTRLVIGSSWDGSAAAGGALDEVFCFKRPLRLAYHYLPFREIAALGPISEAEMTYRYELMAKWQALRAAKAKEAEESGGGMEMLRLVGGTSECITNRPLYITNTVCVFNTNQGWTVTFDVQGTNSPADIFSTTNLSGNNITNSQWFWLERGPSCSTYQYTNQSANQSCYILGTMLDTDGDGLTDAFEKLVSHTDPLVWTSLDTDGDGLSDAWEMAHGYDPANPDSNQNGIPDGYEDFDGDGLANNMELAFAGDPAIFNTTWKIDSDQDGIPDSLDPSPNTADNAPSLPPFDKCPLR